MTTKTKMVVIFNLQNSHLLTLSLLIDEGLQVNGQDRPEANLPVVDFHSQPKEMLTVDKCGDGNLVSVEGIITVYAF